MEVTTQEIQQAITNRKAIAVGSASGPSYLGTATGDASAGGQCVIAGGVRRSGVSKERARVRGRGEGGRLGREEGRREVGGRDGGGWRKEGRRDEDAKVAKM